MSPRMANTTEAVAIDRQLATNSLCGFIRAPFRWRQILTVHIANLESAL